MINYIVGDARDVMATIPDGTVDLIATSPPFLALRSYLPAGNRKTLGWSYYETSGHAGPRSVTDTERKRQNRARQQRRRARRRDEVST